MVWSTVNNYSTELLENVTFNYSTFALSTTSAWPVTRKVSAGMVAAVGLIVGVVGCGANGVVLAVLIRARRHFGSSVHTLIANQCAMDFFACVFGMGTFVMMLTHGYQYSGDAAVDGTICLIFEDEALASLWICILLADTAVTTLGFSAGDVCV